MKLRTPSLGTTLGATALVLSLGGIAVAAIPGPDGTINGCYNPNSGPPYALTIVDTPAGCKSPSVLLPFNQQGPAGSPGSAGPQGVPGPQGPPGIASAVYQASNTPSQDVIQAGGQLTVSLPLPAGAYAVTARVADQPGPATEGNCRLVGRDSSGFHDSDNVNLWSGFVLTPVQDTDPRAPVGRTIPGDHYESFVEQDETHASLQIATTLGSAGGVELSCRADHFVDNLQMRVMAVKVGAVASYQPDAAAIALLRARPQLPRKPKIPTHINVPPPPNHLVH
jgi:hypothetical protein